MLQRGNNNRAARGQQSDRSRGRGRARGAPNSSDTSNHSFEQERLENAAKREQRGQHPTADSRRGGRAGSLNNNRGGFAKHSSAHNSTGSSIKESSPAAPNPFATTKSTTTSPFGSPAPTSANPFAAKPKPSASNNPFGASNGTTPMANPFGAPSQLTSSSVFGAPSVPHSSNESSNSTTSVFGAPSIPQSSSNPFGAPPTSNGANAFSSNPFASNSKFGTPTFEASTSTPSSGFLTATSSAPPTSFGGASTSVFSIPSSTPSEPMSTKFGQPSQSPFASTTQRNATPIFGAQSKPLFSSTSSDSTSKFGAPSASTAFAGFSTSPASKLPAVFGAPNSSIFPAKQSGTSSTLVTNGTTPKAKSQAQANASQFAFPKGSQPALSSWSLKLSDHLRKEGIVRPPYPGQNPGDPKDKAMVESFFRGKLRQYRTAVRNSLMRAGLMDDPDKPKKLSEAIDFKGTCEDMCPYKEKFERIIEGSTVANLEKERSPTGALWPSVDKMVKKHSRSAAGDEEPLPEDVRSPAALRRTLDYLFVDIIGQDEDLGKVHGFLWDRTRAIRRDFVFQAAMKGTEMMNQIYCLEHIIRFHVVALHLMSKKGVASSEFSEQQEVEQLSKSIISLMHAYDDCANQKVECENEAEFRAYYVIFNSQNPAVLESVGDLRGKWAGSKQIETAVNLVEVLQAIWEFKGPLKPFKPTDVTSNTFTKFFCEVADEKTSYIMACFAEIHFNSVRKAALKNILAAYRKQRDQTKDWWALKLNEWLNFDDHADIVPFGEAYGLRFDEVDGEMYLSFDSAESISDPFPRLKQSHSWRLVERKRGNLTLAEVIDGAIYEEPVEDREEAEGEEYESEEFEGEVIDQADGEEEEEEEGLFVKEDSTSTKTQLAPNPTQTSITEKREKEVETQPAAVTFDGQPSLTQGVSKPTSVFDQVKTVKSFGSDFFTRNLTPMTSNSGADSVISTQPVKEAPSALFAHTSTTPPVSSAPPPLFSFSQSTSTKTVEESVEPALSPRNHAITQAPSPIPTPTLGGYKVTKAPLAPTVKATSESVRPSKPPTIQLPLPSTASGVTSALFAPPTSTFNTARTPSIASPTAPLAAPSTTPDATTSTFGGSFIQPLSSAAPHAPALSEREQGFNNFTEWFANGEDGIIDHFVEHQVGGILLQAFNMFKEQEAVQKEKEEITQAAKAADAFRWRSLATRFGERWRRNSRLLRVRRQTREARQLRQEMYEASRAKKVALAANLVDDFAASTRSTRGRERNGGEHNVENLVNATGVLNGVRDIANPHRTRRRSERQVGQYQSSNHIRGDRPVRHTQSVNEPRRGDRSVEQSQSSSQHGRSTTDNPLRRSLLSDPSYLRGESRIFHAKTWTEEDEKRVRPSGTQTDYFRLKARGIYTMPDGSPLASSAATDDVLHRKHSRDGISKPDAHSSSTRPYARLRASSRYGGSEPPVAGVGPLVDVATLKVNARAVVEKDKMSRKRRSEDLDDNNVELSPRAKGVKQKMDDEDDERTSKKRRSVDLELDEEEKRTSKRRRSGDLNFSAEEIELLARAKRVKEAMSEGQQWYRKELERDSRDRESGGSESWGHH